MTEKAGARDARSILKNTTVSFASLVLGQGMAMVSAAYLGRALGPSITGVYTYAFGVVSLVMMLANCGTDQALTREVSREPKSAGRLLISSLSLRILVSCLLYVTLVLLFHFGLLGFKDALPRDARLMLYVVWLTLFVESAMQGARAVFAGLERQEISSAILTAVAITRAALTILVVYLGMGLFHMGVVVFIVGIVGALLMLKLLSRMSTLEFRIDREAVKSMARVGSSFLLVDISLGLVARFDYLYLPMVIERHEYGLYTASYRLLEGVMAGALAMDTALFPVITRRCEAGVDSLRKAWDVAHKYLAVIAAPIAVIFTLLAEGIMLLIYGSKFAGSGAILSVVIWTVVIFFPMIPSYRILIARNGQMRLLPLLFIRLIVNIGLNLLLVPKYGALGSAIAKVAMEGLHCVLCFSFAFRTVELFPIVRWYSKPVLAALPMAAFIYLFRDHYHVVATASTGAIIYALGLLMLRAFSRGDLQMLRMVMSPAKGAVLPESEAP